MGLFRKKRDDSEERRLHRDLSDEIPRLQEAARERGAEVQEAESRLRSVRAEYDQVLSNLMSTKKEINDRREEKERLERVNEGIRMQIDEGRRTLKGSHKDMDLARRAAVDLERVTSDVKAKTAQSSTLDSKVRRAQKRLDKINAQMGTADGKRAKIERDAQRAAQRELAREVSKYKSRLSDAEAERNRLQSQLDAHVEMVENLKQRLSIAEEQLQAPAPQQQPNKGVVEAASALVASFRERLAESQDELARTRQRLAKLERERADDNQ